jgi:hypothetical protein
MTHLTDECIPLEKSMTEPSEIVRRLREVRSSCTSPYASTWPRNPDGHEAARLIEALIAERDALKAGLREREEGWRNAVHALDFWQREAVHAGKSPDWSLQCQARGRSERQRLTDLLSKEATQSEGEGRWE